MKRSNTQPSLFSGQRFSTAVQQINYPIHRGQPNPAHGKFFIVGSVPVSCDGVKFDTEEAAIRAVVAAGATVVQGADCRMIDTKEYQA